MELKLTEHKKGEKGFLCMPMAKHLPKDTLERHSGWKKINCPYCGKECYETELCRESLRSEPNLSAACTLCALELGKLYD